MSKRLQAAQPRSPRALPPARLPALLLLLLGPGCLLSPSPRGEDVGSRVESPRLQLSKDQPKDYEITIPFLLNGEQWRPVDGIYSKAGGESPLFSIPVVSALGQTEAWTRAGSLPPSTPGTRNVQLLQGALCGLGAAAKLGAFPRTEIL